MEDWNYAQSGDEEGTSLSSENSADLLPSIQNLVSQFQMDSVASKDRFEAAMMSQDENDDNNNNTVKLEKTSIKNWNDDVECETSASKNEEETNLVAKSQQNDLFYDDNAIQSSLPDEEEESIHEKDVCNSQFDDKASISSLEYEDEKSSSSSSEDAKTKSVEEDSSKCDLDREASSESDEEEKGEFSLEILNENERNKETFEDAQNELRADEGGFSKRLEVIIKELSQVREELSKVRENCREESEFLSVALEKALEYNKSLEASTMAALTWDDRYITPPSTTNSLTTALLLENKLRISRQNASAAYRAQLDQLEALVDKEMNALQDNMTRLEPLNRIATGWENQLEPEPKSLMYRHDYTVEVAVASSQVSVKANDSAQRLKITK